MTEHDSAERRQFVRIALESEVRLYSGAAMWKTELVDLSFRGVSIKRPADFEPAFSPRYRLDLRLGAGHWIGLATKLVRDGRLTLAFAIERLDFDSFGELKRLVELNLGNVELLNRELNELVNAVR